MQHRSALTLVLSIGLLAAMAACTPSRKSVAGLSLPDGDPHAGRTAFVQLRCNACHVVNGLTLESPVADPPVPVVLGGEVLSGRRDGQLAMAIISPSHSLAWSARPELIRAGARSRMGDFTSIMTVQQLVDIVAFLHEQYKVVQPNQTY